MVYAHSCTRGLAQPAAANSCHILASLQCYIVLCSDTALLLLLPCRNTPGLLSTAGLAAAVAAAALVYLVPDDSTGLVAAQVAGASALGAGAIAAFVGSSILGNLQKV
jgi:hypothetical protein